MVADHPEKEWKVSALSDLIKKIDETGEIKRKEGSGRPRSARTDENINSAEEMICSQEDQPGKQKLTSIGQTNNKRTPRRPLKKIKGQRLSEADCEKRAEKSSNLLRIYTQPVLKNAFFSDEKILKVQQLYNAQNDRIYAPKDAPRLSVVAERLICERSGFPKHVMVSVIVSKLGKTDNHSRNSSYFVQSCGLQTVLT